jgi:uncharacterized protein YyaL (SSP411 family)
VLTRRIDIPDLAKHFRITVAEVETKLADVRARMLAVRAKRVPPGLDDKVLASWNGLALAAFAEAARVLGDGGYRAIAERNAALVREVMWRDGVLLHTYKDGVARIEGMVEDYAYYGLGLVELFKLTGEMAHLDWAREMLDILLERFRDMEGGGFYETAKGAEELILRQKSFFDSATPSGNGAAALLALWLSRYYSRPEWEGYAIEAIGLVRDQLVDAVTGFGTLWQAIEFLFSPPRELIIVGAPAARAPLEREAGRHYVPWLAVAPSSGGSGLPLFEGREDATAPLAYLCENMACQLPVGTPEALGAQLAGGSGGQG